MKFTSAIVLAALLNCSDVQAIKMPTRFIDDSDVQMRDDVPAGDAIQKRLDDAKASEKDLESKKNATKNAKALGDKMKKTKEDFDEKMEKKAEAANAAKEKKVEDEKKRFEEVTDKNNADMEAEMIKAEAIKAKPDGTLQPVGPSQTHTASENWVVDMP